MRFEKRYNPERDGIELSFYDRPPRPIRQQLKQHGFRWHNARSMWYARWTPERQQFTLDLEAKVNRVELMREEHSRKAI